jgi:hypothetical protein
MKSFTMAALVIAAATALCASPAFASGSWAFMQYAPAGLCSPHLLRDGNVLAQICGTQHWYKQHPDSGGEYQNAHWTHIADLPVIDGTQYAPRNYASAVLPDGRLLIEGGEYNNGSQVWTSMGAIYKQSTNTWTPVSPPSSVTQIGDAPSASLKNGTFLLGTCCDNPAKDFLFNPSTLTWSSTGAPPGSQEGQGYELLQTGRILTLDVSDAPGTQLYSGATDGWTTGSSLPASLVDTCGTNAIGPAVVRGDNTVVAFGGDTCGVNPVQTAIRDNATGHWSAGPAIPSICGSSGTAPCDAADAPAALEPSGRILFAASAGYGTPPTRFFELTTGNTIVQVENDVDSPTYGATAFNFVVLPNGQIMAMDGDHSTLYIPANSAIAAWAPTISSYPQNITRKRTYTITGTQLSGRSGGAYQGSRGQAFTNFPIVEVIQNGSGAAAYGYTFDISTFSIAANASGSFKFTLPAIAPTGAATLYVIANGIKSAGVPVTVH